MKRLSTILAVMLVISVVAMVSEAQAYHVADMANDLACSYTYPTLQPFGGSDSGRELIDGYIPPGRLSHDYVPWVYFCDVPPYLEIRIDLGRTRLVSGARGWYAGFNGGGNPKCYWPYEQIISTSTDGETFTHLNTCSSPDYTYISEGAEENVDPVDPPHEARFVLVEIDSYRKSGAVWMAEIQVLVEAPVADAGPDRTVDTASVTLDGSGSTAPAGATYTWTWGDTGSATGETPSVVGLPEGTTIITLVVSDGVVGSDLDLVDSAPDTVGITVDTTPPMVSAGNDVFTLVHDVPIQLTGMASDSGGVDPASLEWLLPDGTTVAGQAISVLVTEGEEIYVFSASDLVGNPASADVKVVGIDISGLLPPGLEKIIKRGGVGN
jgi:hypothetical protein